MTDEIENADIETPEAAPEETPEQKEKSGIQKRIDEITRQKYEAINERDLLKKEREELAAKLAEFENQKKPDPTLESFDYDEDAYNQALIDQRAEAAARKILEQERTQQTQAQEQAKVLEQVKAFSEKESKFAQEIQDYDQVAKNPNLPINDVMADIIRTSDNGPALAYHLGKNPHEAYRISQLPPMQAQRELLNIEHNFTKPASISTTPEPVPDIGGNDIPIKDMDDLPTDEWMKRRRKQVYGK
jgi:hypothetical protein